MMTIRFSLMPVASLISKAWSSIAPGRPDAPAGARLARVCPVPVPISNRPIPVRPIQRGRYL
jgi:hypothetical protein